MISTFLWFSCTLLLAAILLYGVVRLGVIIARGARLQYKLAYAAGCRAGYRLAAGWCEKNLRSFTFLRHEVRRVGLLREVRIEFFLTVTLVGDKVKYLVGDTSNIEKFKIPGSLLVAIRLALGLGGISGGDTLLS